MRMITGFIVGAFLSATVSAITAVPMATPDFAQRRADIDGRSYLQNDLGQALGYHIRGQRVVGGSDQSFEQDVFLHMGASSPSVYAAISNIMSEGGSYAGDVREGGAGADIRGTVEHFEGAPCHVEVHDAGQVGTVTCYEASYSNQARISNKQSFVDHDHTSTHFLAGTTAEIDRLRFSNGWTLEAHGDSLELHDSKGIVQVFR